MQVIAQDVKHFLEEIRKIETLNHILDPFVGFCPGAFRLPPVPTP